MTIDYYDSNSGDYVATTRNINMTPLYREFLKDLPAGAYILDAGGVFSHHGRFVVLSESANDHQYNRNHQHKTKRKQPGPARFAQKPGCRRVTPLFPSKVSRVRVPLPAQFHFPSLSDGSSDSLRPGLYLWCASSIS